MEKHVVAPEEFRRASEAGRMSPGILSGDFLFVTGMAGGDISGSMPADSETQFRNAFEKIEAVIVEAGLTLDSIVEMTTYHIGLREHFDLFDQVRTELFDAPYPAWTAVEVAGLRREGAIVEIRVIAKRK